MTNFRPPDPSVEEQLATAHWHIVRGDSMRVGVASRAGAVLSTNALVLTGIALALSLRSQRPNAVVIVTAIVALGCVVFSVVNAALALITIRSWSRQFGDQVTPATFLYCQSELSGAVGTFEDFKRQVASTSPEEHLEFALAELWRCSRLHGYRYRKLRVAMCWLLAALVVFLVAAVATAIR